MVLAGAALVWSGVDRGSTTGRVGRIDPTPAAVVSAADLHTLAEIHADSVNALRECIDERRGALARAGGASHTPVHC